MEEANNNRALAITFMILGFSLSVSLATTLGVAFVGVGIPFAIIGFVFLQRGAQEDQLEESE